MSADFGGSHIACDLGVGCNETGICYAEAHGDPSKCGVTIRDGVDLTTIAPLTEAEADAYFNQPTIPELYAEALVVLGGHPDAVRAVERYVALLKQRLAEAREAQYRAESRIQSIRDNY